MAGSKPLFQRDLFLYKITQNENRQHWDVYDSFVVAARTSSDAKFFHPSGAKEWNEAKEAWVWSDDSTFSYAPVDWVSPWELLGEHQVVCVGRACHGVAAGDIICSSFKAG